MTTQLALVGNPNSGKTTIFNYLTGLQQKTGNYPGVTVDRKSGTISKGNDRIHLIDLPGTYSLYPLSNDEQIVNQVLLNREDQDHPEGIIYILDITQVEKHLLFYTQIRDLGFPLFLVINMVDLAEKRNITISEQQIHDLQPDGYCLVSREEVRSLENLKDGLFDFSHQVAKGISPKSPFYQLSNEELNLVNNISQLQSQNEFSDYTKLQLIHHVDQLPFLNETDRSLIQRTRNESSFNPLDHQVKETLQRFESIQQIVPPGTKKPAERDRFDRIATHKLFGPILFFSLLFLVFQAIYSWANYPMDWIENIMLGLTNLAKGSIGQNWFGNLIGDGIIPGLAGVLVFIPQIAILFFCIGIMEESGYMARVVVMFDRIMQKFGLNGRSIVALISGGACAIPAIMSARTINNSKERLITTLVTPFISCSARTPVYIMLIAFALPATSYFGWINLQGLAFMGLYLLGVAAALLSAWVLKKVLKAQEASYLMIELPEYRIPKFKNLLLYTYDKVKGFVVEAGKIILMISIVLWFMASYGPKEKMEMVEVTTDQDIELGVIAEQDRDAIISSRKLEQSFAGILGKQIEPAIQPLGFDWKIGIALVTSFAAREVFVGTMATIYSIGDESDELKIRDLLKEQRNERGDPIYSPGTAWALILFYVFALQCMSTMAVVKKETGSWKWPILQFIGMGLIAYLTALLAYQLI